MHFQFFVFAWPGYLEAAEAIESELKNHGQEVWVIASGLENGPQRWLKLSDDAYFGTQFQLALSRFTGDVLVHIQADAHIRDYGHFLDRLRESHMRFAPGVWAPDVNYSFYQTRLVLWPTQGHMGSSSQHDPDIVPVLNTDCTCWSLTAAVADSLRGFASPHWNLGWGWDTLASALSWSMGLQVLRDLSVVVDHPRGTGYNSQTAEDEFREVKSSLPSELRHTVLLQEAIVLERYRYSPQWMRDRIRSLW